MMLVVSRGSILHVLFLLSFLLTKTGSDVKIEV